MQEIKKIVVIGPESTGKSSLCRLLATHYDSLWCPEYAREYLLTYGTNYTYDDLLTIAKGQIALEDQYIEKTLNQPKTDKRQSQSALLFVDTDMYVMKVWCEYVFGKCHQFILDEIVHRHYDLYLLCKPDITWVKDELREYPDEQIRIELYHIYRDILINQNVPWIEVTGNYEQRLQMSINAVENAVMKSR